MAVPQPEPLFFENYDDFSIVTPVYTDIFEELLIAAKYPTKKTRFLINGFRNGFSLGYRGPKKVKIKSPNLKLRIGNETDLWNKVMKEVQAKRYAGPYPEKDIPFDHYIQSPIGLVPKDGGKNTRLIFHLSYPKNGSSSVNANTPDRFCSVKYPDVGDAIRLCLEAGKFCFVSKSDMKSAFRQLGISRKYWKYLMLKARSPRDGLYYYFFDKAVPFGSSVSCCLFQQFSDAVAYLVTYETGKKLINYLDDYFFVAMLKMACNRQIQVFLDICKRINFPVSFEKTVWACTSLTFLGFLLDTINQTISLPCEKIARGRNMIESVLTKVPGKPLKMKILQLQKICGFLNFLGRAIIPGRAFTRRLYAYLSDKEGTLKQYHHVRVNSEIKSDLTMWLNFLQHPTVFCRPFMDYSLVLEASELDFYVDASKNPLLGFGGYCFSSWMQCHWNGFIEECNPSIEYLELYAMAAGILMWIHHFKNSRVIVFTDNDSVKWMLNTNSSKCKNCMVLIRIVVLHCLVHNVRVYGKHVRIHLNGIADSLSRFQRKRFAKLTKNRIMNRYPCQIPDCIWPPQKLWLS